MDILSSTNYPYASATDSISFHSIYREHKKELLSEVKKRIKLSDFYSTVAEYELRNNKSHDDRWLIMYDGHILHSVYNWKHTSNIDSFVSYIKGQLDET